LRTRCLTAAILAAALIPSAAAADPVTIAVHSTENGGTAGLAPPGGGVLTIGSVTLPTAEAAVNLSFTGLAANTNYLMEVIVYGASSMWNTLRAEVLDPLDGDDGLDVAPYHDGVPAGYSTSNTRDGFSFAQSSSLVRSGVFAGGFARVTPDETTNAADVLLFTGVAGASDAIRVTFGLRDYDGNRSFLVRLSAADGVSTTPEPASMLLIGSGLAGLAVLRRRRRESGAGV
jgi:hypothetical protein